MSERVNRNRIKIVHAALGELANQVIFIGGDAVSLYKDRIAEEIRPTDDIDIVLELAGYGEYAILEEQLREKGFANDMESGIVCRYKIQEITVDIMPTESKILGFTNRWYKEGYLNSIDFALDNDTTIKLFAAPWFLASKFEAFNDRGRNDGRTSSDFEDIVYILNNRTTIWREIEVASVEGKEFLHAEFDSLLYNESSYEWISGHIEYGQQNRVDFILEEIRKLMNGFLKT